MPTPSQNQNARLMEGRLETQEQRLEDLAQRLDRYDKIITDLHTIVIALKAKSDANQKWVATMFTVGATLVGGVLGAVATTVLMHLH